MTYEGLLAERNAFTGHGGATIEAYYGRPLGAGPYPGVVVIHHMPGWDEWTREVVHKFAMHGFAAVSPHLYSRVERGSPDEMATRARAGGGVPDDQSMGDIAASVAFLREQPQSNGKVGVIGFCSGGRQAFLAACTVDGLDAAVDCWGGAVIVDDPNALPEPIRKNWRTPPIERTAEMKAPLLGIFGNEDRSPTPDQVNRTEEELKKHGKTYEFHRYDGAGHGFFATDRAGYRPEQAQDAWGKVFAFYDRYLGSSSAGPSARS